MPTGSGARALRNELLEMALTAPSAAEMIRHLGERLPDLGVHVARIHITYTTLHPLKTGEGATWWDTGELISEGYARSPQSGPANPQWLQSPMHHAIQARETEFRRRLPDQEAEDRWPILRGFSKDGMTDYLLLLSAFESFATSYRTASGDGEDAKGVIISFTSRAPGGFDDRAVEILTDLRQTIAVVTKMASQEQIAMNLATCYIGREAGPRVLNGAIRRGDVETRECVVWFSDLRDSTELASALPRDAYIRLINDFFDCTAGAVTEEGGEPMTYIGDGALAIFPVESLGPEGARQAAIAAAGKAAEMLRALNAARADRGERRLGYGLALHAGEMDYGNIGVPARQAWSVIGPVVNQTVRLEGLTKTLGAPVVASGAFAGGLDPAWRDLGAHALRGVDRPIRVFTPPR